MKQKKPNKIATLTSVPVERTVAANKPLTSNSKKLRANLQYALINTALTTLN